jgi:cytochrome b6-f complex iron-sulfur subunit
MTDLQRRNFLSNAWKIGAGLIAAAGAWTTWDLLQPQITAGFGGIVRTVPPDTVPTDSVVEVRAARAYLTQIDGEIVALSEVCSHLGCRVPWCASSGRFECPCHGSVFNRAGDYESGPAPRGMDRYPTTVVDGIIEIDTSSAEPGPAPGVVTIDEPVRGPACAEGSHG